MNVLHLGTFDAQGAAAVAAVRLVESLRRRGHEARLLVREKASEHHFVEAIGSGSAPSTSRTDPSINQLAWLFSQRGREAKRTLPFSSDLPTYDLTGHAAVRNADVLHLHWVTGFLSAFAIRQLQDLGKPMVWTLHDQFPFTGGCHYVERCRGFAKRCRSCPELVRDAQALASLTLAQKRQFIDPRRLLIAAPSRWIAASAKESALFRRARIDIVPYGIDVRARRAVTREASRTTLEIPDDAIVVLAMTSDDRDPRQGHAHLVEALQIVVAKYARRVAGLRERLLVLTAGPGGQNDKVHGVTYRALGELAADAPQLTMAHRAADIFVLPSLEENLPNAMLEAMAAGTPVVAYKVGGIPDMLQDGLNGRLAGRGNVGQLASAIADLAADEGLRQSLGDAAALTARTRFDWTVQAEAYERMYHAELARRHPARRSKPDAFKKNPHADAPKLKTLLTDRTTSRLLVDLLRRHVDELTSVIAARGGEIAALRAELSRGADVRSEWETNLVRTVRDHEDATNELQSVIAQRGSEIRELRKSLGDAQQAGARRKEVLSHLMRARTADRTAPRRLNVGIFGVGESGRRLLEAAVLLDCNIVWLADNNADLQGHTDLGCAVMRPEALPGVSFDAAIVASPHRDAIRQQLIHLGIDRERIVAPDVTRTDAEIFEELRRLLQPHRHDAIVSTHVDRGRPRAGLPTPSRPLPGGFGRDTS